MGIRTKRFSPEVRDAGALFALALAVYAFFYGGWGANQEVNYALTRAVVEGRTFAVDRFTVHDGDIASGRGGRIYSNKPPGLSMLAVPPYALQYVLQQRKVIRFRDYWRTNKRLVTVQVCGLAGALIPAILYLYGRWILGVSRSSAALVAALIAFGTLVLPYSTMLFAHVPAALFLLLAFVLARSRPFLAGIAIGIATSCFLLCALAALVILALVRSIRFVAGAAPFAVALAVYQWICFGSPFVTSLERSSSYTEHGLLLGVFGAPQWSRLWALTFSEYRGLFFCCPILLFAFAGMFVMVRRFRAELLAILAIAFLLLVATASFNGWHGGAAFGPRYLLPVIPLLAIPMMFVADRWRVLWLAAGALSIFINVAATLVDPMPLDGMEHPLTRYIVPSLLRGETGLAQDSELFLAE